MNEPKVVCVQCHRYVPLSEAQPFMLRGEEYHECSDCAKPDTFVPDPALASYIERHREELEMGMA